MVVDDDSAVRFVLAEILEAGGFRTVEASNGQAALDRCQEPDTPLLAIGDLAMPTMDGYGFMAEIQARQPRMPVIAVSGELSLGTQAWVRQLGTDGCIAKPFAPDEVISAARRVLDAR
ncbi:MAG: CheY-like chemotaxis protein [Myxococcota bacterium]